MVVYSGDGDLFAIGGNHFIHAARRNMDIKVICVNNLIYAMTGGQTGADHARRRHHRHHRPTAASSRVQPAAAGRSRRRRLRGALDHLPREATGALHGGGARTRRASASSKSSRPAPRSTSAATSWATAWTP